MFGELDTSEANRVERFAAFAEGEIRRQLQSLLTTREVYAPVVLLFSEEDDYCQYIADFYPEAEFPRTGGIYLTRHCSHMAVLNQDLVSALWVLGHELAHAALQDLPRPPWLNEGLALQLQRVIQAQAGTARHVPRAIDTWADSLEAQRQYWDPDRIQGFWAGTSFHEPGEAFDHSYALAEVLVHLLSEKDPAGFLNLVWHGKPADAGQTAAIDWLGANQGEAAGSMLGPGNWHPVRQKMASLLNLPPDPGRPG